MSYRRVGCGHVRERLHRGSPAKTWARRVGSSRKDQSCSWLGTRTLQRPMQAGDGCTSEIRRKGPVPPAPSPIMQQARALSGAADGRHYGKHDDRPDDRGDDGPNDTTAEIDPDRREQETGDECADDSDDDVAPEPEPRPFDDLTGQPAGNSADDQRHDETR